MNQFGEKIASILKTKIKASMYQMTIIYQLIKILVWSKKKTKKIFVFCFIDLDSDEESRSTEFYTDHVEIGLPKILKYTNKISRMASRLSFDKYFQDEIVYETQNFFRLSLGEYLNGGIICQFCQKYAFNWKDAKVYF